MKALLVLFAAMPTLATTKADFHAGGDYVNVRMLGLAEGSDARHLYDALAIAPNEAGGTSRKTFAVTDASGVQIFTMNCLIASKLQSFASCTYNIRRSDDAEIKVSEKRARYLVSRAADAQALAEKFRTPGVDGLIFVSEDRRTRIEFSPTVGFQLSYAE